MKLIVGLLIVSGCWGQLIPFPGPGGNNGGASSNTYTCKTQAAISSRGTQICYVINPTTGTTHTVTVNGAGTAPFVTAACFSGVGFANAGDNNNTAGSGSTIAPGSVALGTNGVGISTVRSEETTVGAYSINIGTVTDQSPLVGGTNFSGAMAFSIQSANWIPTWSISGGSTALATAQTGFTVTSGTAALVNHVANATSGPNGATTASFNSTTCTLIVVGISSISPSSSYTITDTP